ncbi:MAG: hypothetical protein EXR58_04125 [Chloroflexi bacterium]|nr:hypothetical protein [Chloroflexota bacterium]
MGFDVLRWLVGIELIGFAAWPLAARLFAVWPDRGYAWAKILGLLIVGYLVWLGSMLGVAGFTGPTLMVVAGALALVGWSTGPRPTSGVSRRLVALEEGLFLATFVAAVAVRSFSPAADGQEKAMDFNFLHSLIQADHLPAADHWLAGYGLPYYYFGYLIQSIVPKLAAIDASVAYNLALASIPALAAMGAFGLVVNQLIGPPSGTTVSSAAGVPRATAAERGRPATGQGGGRPGGIAEFPTDPADATWRQLAGPAAWGLLGALGLTVLGNLEALIEVLAGRGFGSLGFWTALGVKNLTPNLSGGWFPTDGNWWFHAARVIPNIEPDGITEFPYFSFLLGDLHPHFMTLPLFGLIGALAIVPLYKGLAASKDAVGGGDGSRTLAIQIGAQAVVLGAVIPTNTWDVPTLWGVFAAGTIGGGLVQLGRSWPLVGQGLRRVGLILGLAVALYLPYLVGYQSPPLGLSLVVGERTPLGSLMILFGVLLVLPVIAGLVELSRSDGALSGRIRFVAIGGIALGGLLSLGGQPTLGVLFALLILWALVLGGRLSRARSALSIAAAAFALAGLAAILLPELIFLRDSFGTRMNTVFKFYYDGWVLLALAAPLLGWELWSMTGRDGWPSRVVGVAGLAACGLLALAGLLYPLGATPVRTNAFLSGPTLDGMVHLRVFRPDDAAAIDWLQRLHPGVRVAEAIGDDYSDAGRFATFGGAIAPLGWIGHELQWRGQIPDLVERQTLVRQLYTAPTEEGWRAALKALHLEFVAVGTLEREIYGPGVSFQFEGALQPAYQSGATVLYRAGSDERAAS